MIFPDRPIVKSKAELVALIFELLDHNDAVEWRNETAHEFLRGLAGWLEDADGFYENLGAELDSQQASWQLFAGALQAAAVYE